jgi:putative ABC transport system ATP-binding protein
MEVRPSEAAPSAGDSPVLLESVLLECRGLTRHYEDRRGTLRVLEGLDLVVRAGESLVVHGRSGAGKSTLLGLLGGLDRPTAGSVRIEGADLAALPRAEVAAIRREKIGIIFQSFNLLPAWTAQENVEAALLPGRVPPAERRARARRILEELGLGGRLDHLPSELSAGEEQRTALARALVNGPRLILADEPTGDVDEEAARAIVERLLEPVRAGKAALVVATHGAFPLSAAHRALRLEGGKLG